MGIRSDRDRGFQQQPTSEPSSEYINSDSNTVNVKHFDKRSQRNRVGNFFVRQLRLLFTEQLHYDNPRGTVPIHSKLSRTWDDQPDNNTKGHNYKKRHRYNKYIYPVIATVFSVNSLPLQAENVGGVSATANPIANSSGSVTNQAIQVLQGPYITNTYGNGIQCQGPTMNITPFLTGNIAVKRPYESYYMDPVYNNVDANNDDVPDNPGEILYYKPVRTGQKDSSTVSLGISATWSKPLDKKLQDQCKEAAQANINLMVQSTANKRLDFEIARLKNCGELMKSGIMFHKN